MTAKEQLHSLVDMLPEAEVLAASRYLQFLANEIVDEPLADEDWHEVRAGETAIANGDFTTLEDIKRELKLAFSLRIANTAKSQLRRLFYFPFKMRLIMLPSLYG